MNDTWLEQLKAELRIEIGFKMRDDVLRLIAELEQARQEREQMRKKLVRRIDLHDRDGKALEAALARIAGLEADLAETERRAYERAANAAKIIYGLAAACDTEIEAAAKEQSDGE